jgi:hypothetical protein
LGFEGEGHRVRFDQSPSHSGLQLFQAFVQGRVELVLQESMKVVQVFALQATLVSHATPSQKSRIILFFTPTFEHASLLSQFDLLFALFSTVSSSF